MINKDDYEFVVEEAFRKVKKAIMYEVLSLSYTAFLDNVEMKDVEKLISKISVEKREDDYLSNYRNRLEKRLLLFEKAVDVFYRSYLTKRVLYLLKEKVRLEDRYFKDEDSYNLIKRRVISLVDELFTLGCANDDKRLEGIYKLHLLCYEIMLSR